MISTNTSIIQKLYSLADNKICLLQALWESLDLLDKNIEQNSSDEILAQLATQDSYQEQICNIDENFNALHNSSLGNIDPTLFHINAEVKNDLGLPQWYFPLYEKLQIQRALLSKILDLNKKTRNSTKTLQATLKNKIIAVAQQKNILKNYSYFDNKTGNLFDYTEG